MIRAAKDLENDTENDIYVRRCLLARQVSKLISVLREIDARENWCRKKEIKFEEMVGNFMMSRFPGTISAFLANLLVNYVRKNVGNGMKSVIIFIIIQFNVF